MMLYKGYSISQSTPQVRVIIIGLVASSLKRLSTEEAGIKYDVIQRVLDKSLYTAGKDHYHWFVCKFIETIEY